MRCCITGTAQAQASPNQSSAAAVRASAFEQWKTDRQASVVTAMNEFISLILGFRPINLKYSRVRFKPN